MPTYTDAAKAGYDRVLKLWDECRGFEGEPDAFWLSANTLRTVTAYLLMAPVKPPDTTSFIVKALDSFEKMVPFDATDEVLKKIRKESGIWVDDFGWWAIAFILAAQNDGVLGLEKMRDRLLRGAEHCWKLMGFGWDTKNTGPVEGGVWNTEEKKPMSGRNCVTNEVFWLTSLRLYQFAKDRRYLDPTKGVEGVNDQPVGAVDAVKFFQHAHERKLLFIQYSPEQVFLVRERFDEVESGLNKPDWFWAGDQGLFIACCHEDEQTVKSPTFKDMANKIADAVLERMTDSAGVLHDQVSPDEWFVRDYATGKGVLFDYFGFLAAGQRLDSKYPQFMLNNAAAVWNSRIKSGEMKDQFLFNWRQPAQPPKPPVTPPRYGDEKSDTFPAKTADHLVLQVAGLSALIQAMKLAPKNLEIPSEP
jgi:hypothetical protein